MEEIKILLKRPRNFKKMLYIAVYVSIRFILSISNYDATEAAFIHENESRSDAYLSNFIFPKTVIVIKKTIEKT